jgi:2-aminoethylphosphonate-pyruvate transaminase|tara:strand:+ start:9630 stop:10604 length:975 start_codon:yes stop_codon:yes gene_type:complete
MKSNLSIKSFIKKTNNTKFLYTPGPGSLIEENILGLEPCFGRNDKKFLDKKKKVYNFLKKISGQKKVVSLQGSASLAIEIACYNFLNGKVLVIDTGYYSDRLFEICKQNSKIKKLHKTHWLKIDETKYKYDWIIACYVETSLGIKIPIEKLKIIKKKYKSKIMLDATASIGLEEHHSIADVCCFSSCKGLFGFTGASFITFNIKPINKVKSFYLNIKNHINMKMTGPYHSILSLYEVTKKYQMLKFRVKKNKELFQKKFKEHLVHDKKLQPLLCTSINKKIRNNKNIILYKLRVKKKGSVVCHLGGLHLNSKMQKKIINKIDIV